ncbi:C40 family peptidase [Altibacter sp. HG106]|uniref:C40 family peptidase n=1 Tax=Altibacter sp. HG106 TaxID=3023937 RepID=UPI002350900A|nr:C40 family peptidase [Altibacter sp. HG106]MDC7994274.1 C40 family peptidase [Altibacter sp. HG106]
MKHFFYLLFFTVLLSSCGGSKNTSRTYRETTTSTTSQAGSSASINIVNRAKSFEGVRYKYGGMDKRGMDCSGLVYTCFQEENITMPRISRDMAKQGKRIALNQISAGDLVFFQTNKNRKVINHVGLVVDRKDGEVFFIHSTTSRGVIISSLNENYWKRAFVEVRRVI